MAKVLMLGWEFPPLFTGGLGIATYGLVKALSPQNHIRLIIPTSAGISDFSNVNVIGLNCLSAEEINLERLQHTFSSSNTEVHEIPLMLSPYHHLNEIIEQQHLDTFNEIRESKKTIDLINQIFSDREVYGPQVMHKVFLFSKLAEEIASDNNFDVIHAHDWITFPAALNIKAKTGKQLILHVHSLETDRAGHETRNAVYALEKKAMALADKIIAVSQFTKSQIIEHYDIGADKIIVVHNGIDPAQTKRKPHQLKDKLVAFLGRLTNQKGPKFLLETAEKVSRVYPRVKFVVAGTGDQFTHLLEDSAFKKIGSKFIFTGFLSKAKVNELLSMADVYFMPSVSEPFGLSALEAAQYNVPSVISVQSGAAEVMTASLKADFWDTDKYANYIYALLKYNTLSKELSEKAKHDLENLTWNHAATKISALYNKLSKN